MSCDGCAGTVWFDHMALKWKHAADGPSCKTPFPRYVNNPVPKSEPTVRKVKRR